MSEHNKRLCMDLLYSESEDEVIGHLKAAGYWDDNDSWRYFGGKPNNWSIIGAQQASPVAATVEKLVNSIDAVLMRECQLAGIPLQGDEAPQSINEALEQFFRLRRGNLALVGAQTRSKLSNLIGLIATGAKGQSKRDPNYTVFDRGEGQTPRDMPKTILSLAESNKLRIPFVQGKFNMGGSGVLRHGGNNRLQVIVSRRCPLIADKSDDTSPYWGFTVIRRQAPPQGERNSIFTYLAPHNDVLRFSVPAINLPHDQAKRASAPRLEWGTIIKMFEYKMKGHRSNIKLDLYYALSLMLPKPGIPIRLYEFRNYRQDSVDAVMSGLVVRLADDNRHSLESGFPLDYPQLTIRYEPFDVRVYAFKQDSSDHRYRKRQGVVFTINGQSHGAFGSRFFSRKKVNKAYLADSLFVIVDASQISARAREDLFMNSRDRLSEGELRDAIEFKLEEIIRDDSRLKALQDQRRRDAIAEKITDSKPFRELLDDMIKKSHSLAALLISGKGLRDPFKPIPASHVKEFKGKEFPTFFRLAKKHQKRNSRPINRNDFRFEFETDAKDKYFSRDLSPGRLELTCDGQPVSDHRFNLLDGVGTLNIGKPSSVEVGDRLSFRVLVTDETRTEPFDMDFEVEIEGPNLSGSGVGNRKPPAGDEHGDRTKPDELSIPNIIEVRRDEWDIHGFNEKSALQVKPHDGSYDYFINLDNIYLNTEIKAQSANEDHRLLQEQFKFSLALIGMMLLKELDSENSNDSDESWFADATEVVTRVSSVLAPAILPMLRSLGALSRDD